VEIVRVCRAASIGEGAPDAVNLSAGRENGKPARIILVNRFFYPDHSATSQLLSDLAFDQAAVGRDVHVVTSRQRYNDSAASLPQRESIRGVHVHRVWTSRLGGASLTGKAIDYVTFYLSSAGRLLRLVQAGDRLVAKTDPPLISVIVAWVARQRGAVLVNWLQNVFPEAAAALGVGGLDGRVAAWLGRLRDQSLRVACCNVVLGKRMAETLRRQGVPEAKIRMIPNWADGESIRPLGLGQSSLRAEWGLRGGFVVAYSGNLGRAHEFETVLEAAGRLRADCGIVFLFIGAGSRLVDLRRQIDEQGLRNFLFQPYQPRERLSQSLGAADVHLISLRPELEGLIVPSKFYGIAAASRATLYAGDPHGEIGSMVRRAERGVWLGVWAPRQR
jgi:colanic acid biosynthesis glycosyl transferase WcaI